MRKFASKEDVQSLTDDEAVEIVTMARDILVQQTAPYDDGATRSVGLDDSGDYIFAAVTNYHRLFMAYWEHDGQNPSFIEAVKNFLLEDVTEWLGSDGEVRYDLFTEEYVEAMG